jgi:hypothetical protein
MSAHRRGASHGALCLHPNGRRKTVYRSPAKARRAARLARGGTMEEFVGRPWTFYGCPVCGGWHLTTH